MNQREQERITAGYMAIGVLQALVATGTLDATPGLKAIAQETIAKFDGVQLNEKEAA